MRQPITRRASARIVVTVVIAALGAGCASTRTTGEQFDDGAITSKITAKLTADPEINPFNIDVDTLDGVVTLRGEVEKERASSEAERLARETRGVRDVDNRIRVVSRAEEDQHRISDSWITTKIKSKLTADPQVNPFDIDVDTQDGVVTLSGRVGNDTARDEAVKLARDTRGVVRVVNELTVQRGAGGAP